MPRAIIWAVKSFALTIGVDDASDGSGWVCEAIFHRRMCVIATGPRRPSPRPNANSAGALPAACESSTPSCVTSANRNRRMPAEKLTSPVLHPTESRLKIHNGADRCRPAPVPRSDRETRRRAHRSTRHPFRCLYNGVIDNPWVDSNGRNALASRDRSKEASRVDLDDLRRAGGLARHAVDAVRLSDHVGLVASILVPLFATLLDDLVVPRAFLAGSQKPLEHVDRADVHADAVRDAAIEVDGDVETVDPEFRRIRSPVGIESLDAIGEDLVVEVGPGLGVFVRLVHEVGVDRFRGKVHFTRHLLAS